jgi:hypothetical protein
MPKRRWSAARATSERQGVARLKAKAERHAARVRPVIAVPREIGFVSRLCRLSADFSRRIEGADQ